MIPRSNTVGNRIDLANLCNSMNLTRLAVEVGTDRGLFARDFLSKWIGEMLYCVDNWQPYENMPFARDGDLAMAVHLLAPFAQRCKLVRGESVDVAKVLYTPNKFNFIYIDGNHEYESVKADLEAWYPRMDRPGVFAGHDIDIPDVKRAVLEFTGRHGLKVETTGDFYSPSWFIVLHK